ncbi:MAG TPA: DUF3311 domain-containing protein [Gemmatimonadales bacterium]|jgi:hypothetical protein|nr:DUF3311 domain-containing protein [Gemmatimonadales bacterium]
MASVRSRRILIGLMFLVVVIVSLWVPLYNRTDPALAGMPFFYWFQIAWIVAGAGAVAVAYVLDVRWSQVTGRRTRDL